MRTNTPTLAQGMRDLNGCYAAAFNSRHNRVGHLLQGRYKSILLAGEKHLLELCRYIPLNPVEAGLTAAPDCWPWSSYRATIGLDRKPRRLDVRALLAPFASSADEGRKKYIDYVLGGLQNPEPMATPRVPTIAGDEAFVTAALASCEPISKEVPRAERAHPSLQVFAASAPRNEAIRAAWATGHYRQVELARHFGLHYTTVSRIIGNSSCQNAKSKDLTP
jgi:hypothetical protein